ncbi:MAG: hypothetical protein R3E86_00690 [Pseudomonadales bacterium]
MVELKPGLTVLGCLCLYVLAACTSSQSPATAQTASSDQVCTSEKVMGSHMPVRVCRSKAEIEAEREAAREALTEIRNVPSVSTEQR